MGTDVTIKDFKDMIEALQKKNQFYSQRVAIIYPPDDYDRFIKERGANCGWNENKVIAMRGYPKFYVL
jgi:hypothetical protein